MKKIKVMQLVWRFSTGGAERMVVNFHNGFAESEYIEIRTLSFTPPCNDPLENEIFNTENSRVLYIPNFWAEKLPRPVSSVFKRLFYYNFQINWLSEQIKTFSPDIIHIHLSNLAARFTEFCKKLPSSIKVIYHMHSMPEAIEEKCRVKIRKAFEENIYYPICVTELQRRSAVKIYGISDAAPIIYNGINESRFSEFALSEEEIELFKEKTGIMPDDFVVGCVGRGTKIKNYSLLAEAVGIISKREKTVLLVVGEIPQKLQLEMLSKVRNAKVIFVGLTQDVSIYYQLMDVFALTSFYESSSIVTVEAELSGLPCVISNRISSEVIISDGVVTLSPDANPEEWAQNILKIKGFTPKINDLNRFSLNNSLERLLCTYLSLVKNQD